MNLAKISISRPIFITCIVVLMLVIGALSVKKMGVDLFPDVTFPVVGIQTVYPGASPNDIENLVSKPIEEELGSLNGLENLRSINQESVSFVVAEFKLGSDIKNAEQQIRDRLGQVRRKLPDDIEEPLIRRFDPSDQPILRLAVESELPPAELFDLLDKKIKNALERVNGVGQVRILGSRKREIRVEINKEKLEDRELTMGQVAARLGATSKSVPLGKVEKGETESVYRTIGEFENLKAIENVVVQFVDNPVRVSDLGVVVESLETENTRTTLNGKSAAFLDIYRQSGTNTIAVSEGIENVLGKINKDFLDQKIQAEIKVVRDGAKPIKLNVADVYESIIIGIVLCIIVVFFFLGSMRSTLITGLALPNSLLGAFIIMYSLGFTINIMTLLALSLAVGLLVDDAIVVRENIFRHLEMGKDPKVAAEEGTNEVAQAVLAVTLVVIAVFGPIAFLQGIVGQFFKQFGLTIVFAMLISLFDAMTIAPMLSAYLASAAEHTRGRGLVSRMLQGFDNMQAAGERFYKKTLEFTLARPAFILLGSIVIFVASMALLKFIPKTFLPPADNGEFEVRIELPPGTGLEKTYAESVRVDEKIRANENIGMTAMVTGSEQGEVNKSIIYVSLKPRAERKLKTFETKNLLREELVGLIPNAVVNVQDIDIANSGDRQFNFYVSGDNLDELSAYVEKLKERMKKIPGLVDVDTNYRLGKPEVQVVFNRAKAESLGVSTVSAGAELRARIEGIIPATYRIKGDEYNIRVRLRDEDRDLSKNFDTAVVPNSNFNLIPLVQIADKKDVSGFSQINRYNRGRFINISGDIGAGGALDFIMNETTRIMKEELPPPPGVKGEFKGQAENFKELIENMLIAIFLGVLFIYLVLSSLYESFITPFSILLALPFAMTGAFAALYITGASINIFSMIGIVMLLGVVAKNSILLIDYIEQLKREGLNRREAILKAGVTRLRPILMTSIALIAGTVPIAVGLNEASAQRTSMGISIIGGLVTSTLLTLVVVPAAYGYIDNLRSMLARMMGALKGKTLGHG
jgi:HAE1 family hydrophobic/amphiphilic exporter-1